MFATYKAYMKYDNTDIAFFNLLEVCVKNSVFKYINKVLGLKKKYKAHVSSLNKVINTDEEKNYTLEDLIEDEKSNYNDFIERLNAKNEIKLALEHLSKEEKLYLICYYIKDMKQNEISSITNKPQSAISKKIKKSRNTLKKIILKKRAGEL